MLKRRNKPQVSNDDRTRNRLKASIAMGIVSTTICLGGCSGPSSIDDGTKPETPSPFSGTYRLTADGLSIGTVEFQGSKYTLVIGDGERKADGEYTYTPETQKLVLHDRATGVTATWNGADFRTFESVQPRSVSNLRTQSNELLTNQAGIAQSTIVPQGCGDENANLLSPTCTLTFSPSSTVASGGIELISENAPLLLAAITPGPRSKTHDATCVTWDPVKVGANTVSYVVDVSGFNSKVSIEVKINWNGNISTARGSDTLLGDADSISMRTRTNKIITLSFVQNLPDEGYWRISHQGVVSGLRLKCTQVLPAP